MTLKEYAAAIDKIAVKHAAIEEGQSYCEYEAWKDSYDDGLSPEEAWEEECAAAH